MIQYKRLQLSEEELEERLPKAVLAELSGRQLLLYGALRADGGETGEAVLGLAVFSVLSELPDALRLHHLFIAEGHRGKGIGSVLLTQSCAELKQAGTRLILFRRLERDVEQLLIPYEFAAHNGFFPIASETMALAYAPAQILENEVVQKTFASKKQMPHVSVLDDPNDPRIAYFNRSAGHGRLMLSPDILELRYSRFYLKGDRILAAVCAQDAGNGVMVIHNMYEAPELADKYVSPVLLLHCMDACARKKDVKSVCVQLSGEQHCRALRKILGEPQEEYRALELVRYLIGR